MQRNQFFLQRFLISAGKDEEGRESGCFAKSEDLLIPLEELRGGHAQGAQRIVQMRIRSCLVDEQIRLPAADPIETGMQRKPDTNRDSAPPTRSGSAWRASQGKVLAKRDSLTSALRD